MTTHPMKGPDMHTPQEDQAGKARELCPTTGRPSYSSFDHGALVCTSCGELAHVEEVRR
jgi:hypothetical protein